MVDVKVRKKRSKKVSSTDMQMLSVLSNSEVVYYDWDKERIIKSLMNEADCDERLASDIADSVEQTIAKSGRKSISSDIIRAMVNEELFNRGKTKILEKQGIYSISRHDIEQLIFSKSNDNSNITKNTPGVVAITIAEILLKRYALDVIFSDDVKEAHLRGEIYLHDLGQSPVKVYLFDGDTEICDADGGTYTLRDLWNMNEAVPVPVNDTQMSKPLTQPGLQKITRTVERKDMVRIFHERGDFGVSAEHGVVVKRGDKVLIVRADELQPNDCLVRPEPKVNN